MKKIWLGLFAPLLLLQTLTEAQANPLRIDIGIFGKKDSRFEAYGDPIYSGVFRVDLKNGGWCSAFLIADSWALTAAHCIDDKPSVADFDLSSSSDSWTAQIKIDKFWKAQNYSHANENAIYVPEDFAVIHLETPAPAEFTRYQIARPDEILVGANAMSVGYPQYKFGGDKKVADRNCKIRGLSKDSILSDCGMSQGNSGGPLLVQTKAGGWKVAGVCSTEFVEEHKMVILQEYTPAKANRWTNISNYAGRIQLRERRNLENPGAI